LPDPENFEAEFFRGDEEAHAIFGAIRAAVDLLGGTTLRVGKSQVAFRRRVAFAWVWVPGRYLRGKRPPLVLTIGLRRHESSPRWKQVVEPYPGRFVHHMELNCPEQVDREVRPLLAEASSAAA
jgi:hypothetical protein